MLTIGDGSLIRFAVVGLSNTLYGLAVIYAAKYVGGLDDIPANILGYATGTLMSFTLNKRWTFRYRGPGTGAFVRFVLVMTTAYLLNLLTVLGALRLGINAYVAQAIGVVPYATFGYLASRHFAFRTPQE